MFGGGIFFHKQHLIKFTNWYKSKMKIQHSVSVHIRIITSNQVKMVAASQVPSLVKFLGPCLSPMVDIVAKDFAGKKYQKKHKIIFILTSVFNHSKKNITNEKGCFYTNNTTWHFLYFLQQSFRTFCSSNKKPGCHAWYSAML